MKEKKIQIVQAKKTPTDDESLPVENSPFDEEKKEALNEDVFDENRTDLETMIHGIDLDVFFFRIGIRRCRQKQANERKRTIEIFK